MKNVIYLIIGVIVAVKVGILNNPFSQQPDYVAGYDSEVVLYATSWCGYCEKTRKLFEKNNIAYTEYDIEESSSANKEFKKLGGKGIPLVVVDGDIVRGYDPKRILSLARGI